MTKSILKLVTNIPHTPDLSRTVSEIKIISKIL